MASVCMYIYICMFVGIIKMMWNAVVILDRSTMWLSVPTILNLNWFPSTKSITSRGQREGVPWCDESMKRISGNKVDFPCAIGIVTLLHSLGLIETWVDFEGPVFVAEKAVMIVVIIIDVPWGSDRLLCHSSSSTNHDIIITINAFTSTKSNRIYINYQTCLIIQLNIVSSFFLVVFSMKFGYRGLISLALVAVACGFGFHAPLFTAKTRGLRSLRMDAAGTGPYRGPASTPLLDSIRYPHDLKQFTQKVRRDWSLLYIYD